MSATVLKAKVSLAAASALVRAYRYPRRPDGSLTGATHPTVAALVDAALLGAPAAQ